MCMFYLFHFSVQTIQKLTTLPRPDPRLDLEGNRPKEFLARRIAAEGPLGGCGGSVDPPWAERGRCVEARVLCHQRAPRRLK